MNGSYGNDSWDGQTWQTAKLTIQNATGTVSPNGVVTIADGTYSGTGNTNITINQNMTIQGLSQNGTIINGTGNNWIFNIQPGITVTLENLTLTNGYTTDVGGAICNFGNLTVNNCNFTQNRAIRGGAIYNPGNLTVNNCTFSNNQASIDGGAIWNYVYTASSTCIINQSTFTNNTANYGGAIMNYDIMGPFTCIINQSTFTGNHAYYNGGAIRNYNFSGGSLTYTITQSTFTDNHANINGGAIHNYNEGSMTCSINFSRFYNNTATSSGNALYNNGGSVNAENNWWGSNDPAFSTLITGEVDYSPWLYLTFASDPLSIPQGSTSTLTASFNQNTDGTNITQLDPANGHIPDGSPVTFTTTLGNVGSKSVLKFTFNGIATAILRADEAAGSALVGILADVQSLTSTVTITPGATTTSVNAATTTNTVGMQSTGAPVVPLALAVLSLLGGLAATRKKQ